MKITVSILKSLILKLENELFFYEEYSDLLNKKRIEIAKKYYVGLKISEFLESLRESEKTRDEIVYEYRQISQEKIPGTSLTLGDVFVINEEDITPDNIKYGLRICKDQKIKRAIYHE